MRVPRKKEIIERILAVIGDLEPRVREHVRGDLGGSGESGETCQGEGPREGRRLGTRGDSLEEFCVPAFLGRALH